MIIAIFGDSVLEGIRYENGKYFRSHELLQLFQAEHGGLERAHCRARGQNRGVINDFLRNCLGHICLFVPRLVR